MYHTLQPGKTAVPNVDMIALWPDDTNPTHLVFCNEQGTSAPGLQRLDLATGDVATILTGTASCDPVHRTAWGTLVFGEEAGSGGGVYELVDPLHTTGVTLNRAAHTASGGVGAGNIAYRGALGNLSFEGLALFGNGVTYYGDENRPSSGNAGGAIYKFVPSTPWSGGSCRNWTSRRSWPGRCTACVSVTKPAATSTTARDQRRASAPGCR